MTDLLAAETFVVPAALVDRTLGAIAAAGAREQELFVAWGGRTVGANFEITSTHLPRQRPLRTADGLMVMIDGEALFELNRALHRAGEVLGAQVHGHPSAAYHSGLDDAWAIATLPGALSIVVPDFASGGRRDRDLWHVFQLQADGRWSPVDGRSKLLIT